jgi:hypothetical protein
MTTAKRGCLPIVALNGPGLALNYGKHTGVVSVYFLS